MSYVDTRTCAEIFVQELNRFQYIKNNSSLSTEIKNKFANIVEEYLSEFYTNTCKLSDFMYEYPDKSRVFIYNYKGNWIAQACH